MGVLENRRNVYFSHDIVSDQHPATSSEDDSDDAPLAGQQQQPQAVIQRPQQPPPSPLVRRKQPQRHGHKLAMKKGRRSRQRYENERELAYEAFGGEVPADVLEGWDIAPRPSRSHFSVLLEAENAAVLKDFVEDRMTVKAAAANDVEAAAPTADTRDPEKAFLGISVALRGALKKHYHEGALIALEQEITDFFRENPKEEYVADDHLSSYERLLAHAVSKYHHLQSRSYDVGTGKRKMTIENPLAEMFSPMDPYLAKYLKIRSNKNQD